MFDQRLQNLITNWQQTLPTKVLPFCTAKPPNKYDIQQLQLRARNSAQNKRASALT